MTQGKALNKEKTIESLIPFFKLGYSLNKACKLAKIHYTTIQKWVKSDEELSIKIRSLQGMVGAKARENIAKEINSGNTKASLWWLERIEREDFSVRTVMRHDDVKTSAEVQSKKRVSLKKILERYTS